MIYFDNAATTYPKPGKVYDYMDWIQRNMAVNTGRGSYRIANEAAQIVEEAKEQLAQLLNTTSNTIFFEPSATIASNVIIGGLEWDRFKVVYVSPFEHNAIMRPLELFRMKYDFKIHTLPFFENTQELDVWEV